MYWKIMHVLLQMEKNKTTAKKKMTDQPTSERKYHSLLIDPRNQKTSFLLAGCFCQQNILTVHSSEGNTGKGRTWVESYLGHGPLLSNALIVPEFPTVGYLPHRTSQCCKERGM